METHKGELFCVTCGANLALGTETEVIGEEQGVPAGKEYIKRTLYLYCPNQNCPQQYKRVNLPQV